MNSKPIKLDYFVAGYLDHVTGGIVASLHDTGEIKQLKLTIDEKGDVRLALNGADVPLNYFTVEIIRSTVHGYGGAAERRGGGRQPTGAEYRTVNDRSW